MDRPRPLHDGVTPLPARGEFAPIRANLDRLSWTQLPIETYLAEARPASIDRFNLSDIFEYVSPLRYEALLGAIVRCGRKGGRLAYWNMLTSRSRPESLADSLVPQTVLAKDLFQQDKAFFYSAFRVEEIA